MFRLGTIELERPIALAPMDDVTDLAYRRLCKRFGADLVYTEFTNVEGIVRRVPRSMQKLEMTDDERPVAIQLYGSNGESLAEATKIVEELGPDFIDINCGCWVKKVANRGDGAGLLKDLKRFEQVTRSVVENTTLPVTVKTRLGWDDKSIVVEDVARMLAANGVQALTVHARTRCQGYTGRADWSWFERIKTAAPDLPLLGNGDVETPEDVKRIFEAGVDGVMIGRGAIANPWLFRRSKAYLATGALPPEPELRERVEVCLEHLRAQVELRGERRGVPSFRKLYGNYLKYARNIAHLRRILMTLVEVEPIEALLRQFLEKHENDDLSAGAA
ncbi:tRNA dihydrouridine synthase DusB [Candidatus Sumerlaeota bacterium]|nr:tRNA dihydrouridine synthase DusB [Candidatus Sumerlaeota bacterium]